MYESINRFKGTPEFEDHLDELFGSKKWREASEIKNSDERREFFYELYEKQLRKAGAKQVIHFDLYSGNRLIYSIFFASQHEVGADRMKAAIWKVAPGGEFVFRGSKTAELPLSASPSFKPLKKQLLDEFDDGSWHDIGEVVSFVSSDRTDYHKGQLKRSTLVPMEKAGLVKAKAGTRKRINTYPAGCELMFACK